MKAQHLLLLPIALCIPAAHAFSAAVPMGAQVASAGLGITNDETSRAVADTGSWRIVLNIGREEFSTMPFGWGASGCRMPLVIKADFNAQDNAVVPRDENCRFTGPGGEVVTPIRPGTWSTKNERNLEFSLNFPEKLQRRDVSLEAGTEIVCEGLVYSKDVIKELNERFYEAREDKWKAGKELNDVSRRKEASKKWNESKQRWEKRHDDEPIWSTIGKRLQLMKAEGETRKKNAERPSPQSLSLQGPFPGFDNNVFMVKEGTIKINGRVAGKWSAEPILDRPVSYYNS
jgi:hypothetical protein